MTDSTEAQFQRLCGKIEENCSGVDLGRVRAAYEFARKAHEGQLRKDGSPFISHPLAAAEIVAEIGLDEESIMASILHDTIEDTSVTHEDIEKAFGKDVAEIVEGVTKLTRVVYTSKEEEQMENLRKMLMAMTKDIRVILIKIADRLHNMRTMEYQSETKQRDKAAETMEIYAPIAHRLGMQKIKWELEDLSIKYLDPVGLREINEELEKNGAKYDAFLSHTQADIGRRLHDEGMDCNVYGRIKHTYSIYRKMYGQNKQLSEVLDLCAFRVIVDSIADCYRVLGIIHDMYRPIPGHFKDYIRTPKPNMYQSLHTTVIGKEGIPFEVQIRTWEMHRTAEYGIAAHWKYKEGLQGHQADEEKFAWIRQLLESQQDSDASDFVHSLKIDLFADEVYVFTPRGDVINLPAGATPIDFAYSIHSAIGNRMVGCKVNGRIVPYSHVLQSGDIVEVLTSKAAKGPSRDWLNLVVSGEARNKIRQWFKKERREENVTHGRAALESELRRAGLSLSDVIRTDVMQPVLRRLSLSSVEDMMAFIGYGGMSAQKIVNRLKDELRLAAKNEGKPGNDPTAWHTTPNSAKSVHGIIVEGLDNCLIKFASCCTPVPGDPVVGFITRGRGVSIHRADCRNYLAAAGDPDKKGRWVRVAWGGEISETYQTTLHIRAQERTGLIMDVATVLTSLKLKVSSMNARQNGGTAMLFITIEVHDRNELAGAITKLLNIRGVEDVRRTGTADAE